MRRLIRRTLVCSLLLAAGACASGGGATRSVRPNPNVITSEELRQGHWSNAYALVEALRPRWLRAHGPDTILGDPVEVQVRLDDNCLGGVTALRGIAVSDIVSMEFVEPVTAAGRWGGDHAAGAICVYTRGR